MPKQQNNEKAQPPPVDPRLRKIGREFRERRKRYKLSQSHVAGWVGISQRQLSSIEKGKAQFTDEQIDKLNSEFEKFDKVTGLDALAFRPLGLLPENEFLSIQQAMLTNWKYSGLWFFGIRHLPVLKERRYQDAWVKNLQAGSSYNLIMVLDKLMEDSLFQLLQNNLSEISGRLKGDQKSHSKITVYGLVIRKMADGESGPLAKTCQSYHRMKRHFDDDYFSGIVDVKEVENIAEQAFDECRAILHYGWLRSVVCYEGKFGQNSFAAVFLDHVSNDPKSSDDGESGWTFLSPAATADLQTNIAQFVHIMEQKEINIHR